MNLSRTQSDATSDQSQAMEFTFTFGQSQRPADQDQVWLALKQATHSGNNVSKPGDSVARTSEYGHNGEHSFTSTDDCSEDDGNKILNLRQAFGPASMNQKYTVLLCLRNLLLAYSPSKIICYSTPIL